MDFEHSARARDLLERVDSFIEREVTPREEPYQRELLALEDPWVVLPVIEELKAKAKAEGLWNLFLPDEEHGAGLTNVEYAPLAERMGRLADRSRGLQLQRARHRQHGGAAASSAPTEQKERWLTPLLAGEIRSAFCMTEPDVASSDATNMQATADARRRRGRRRTAASGGAPASATRLQGRSSSWGSPTRRPTATTSTRWCSCRCDTPGVKVERMLAGDGLPTTRPAATARCRFADVRVPASDASSAGRAGVRDRPGPARAGPHPPLHALIGARRAGARAGLHRRGTERIAFGKPLVNLGGNRERIADARIAIDQARLLVLHAAWLLDQRAPEAIGAVSQIKVAVPNMAQQVVDMAMQLHGGGGLSNDLPLAAAWTMARALRLADGPDEVHRGVVARLELARYGQGKWSG